MNKLNKVRRIVCGISGGVDSSVAALLLKKEGYEVIGAFMRNWDGKDEKGFCQADKDAEDAERTCKALNMPFVEISFVKEYWNHVFQNLLESYQSGFTPNPDILCNYHIKFDSFFNYARERLQTDYIATGHYAQTSLGVDGNVRLLTAQDSAKDQTFFLSHVKQSSLQHTLFPVGHLVKNQVRQIAKNAGLDHVASRADSTGICFIGNRRFQTFISEYIRHNPGPFIDVDSREEVGQHKGIHMWTLGQRCRIASQLKPYFVASKHAESNTIYVASGTNHPALFSSSFITDYPHWINATPKALLDNKHYDCWFRFQHTKPLAASRLSLHPSGLVVTLVKPQRSLAPGQFAVFYSEGECLGCARILQNLDSCAMVKCNLDTFA